MHDDKMTQTGKADEKPEYSLGITFVVMILLVCFYLGFFSIKRKYSLALELYALSSSCCKTWRVAGAAMCQVSCTQKRPLCFHECFQHHTRVNQTSRNENNCVCLDVLCYLAIGICYQLEQKS